MNWYKLTEDESVPSWLQESLPSKCKYCGKPMLSGHNDFGRITGLRCEDMNCPSMIASRIVFILELLQLKGIGFAKALSLVNTYKFSHPIECLKVLDMKPVVDLGTFLRCSCIQGIDGEWVTLAETSDSYTLDELYSAYPDNPLLLEHKDMLYNNLQYVTLKERTVKKAKSVTPIVIMITGTPIGFATKDSFVDACNSFCQGEFKIIHQKTAKQSGVHFLIKEPGTNTRVKVETAKKAGITILTSEQFMQVLDVLMKEVSSNDNP